MTSRKISREQMLSSCDAIGPDDGTDPRSFIREPRQRIKNRKALQLCGQVMRTLSSVLQGECGDDLLRDLLVESVVPAPDSSRLLVTLFPCPSASDADVAELLEHLQRAAGRLRSEVAGAVHRKKTPELLFRVVKN